MTRQTRRAQNEVWFRQVNERLEARAIELNRTGTGFEIVCECADEDCTDRIPIAAPAYERVRAEPTHFIVLPGHEDASIERIVDTKDGYEVVEKIGVAGAIAGAEDPRR